MLSRFGWVLTGALAVVAILALARATTAGSLDPPGPVGSTMRTLDELVPSWGKALSSSGGCNSQRFQCVMTGNAAVLDRETGLVWQRVTGDPVDWNSARDNCRADRTGGRGGWRIPNIEEFTSLYDNATNSGLPTGHPFTVTAPARYFWSASVDSVNSENVYVLQLNSGSPDSGGPIVWPKNAPDLSEVGLWCVRGLPGDDDPVLDEGTSWDRKLDASGGCFSERFECVLSGAAVLDRETGLVWMRTPSSVEEDWDDAYDRCLQNTTGGRTGWRLPTIAELGSLIDQSVAAPAAMLPPGHPFTSATSGYWSTTEVIDSAGSVYAWKLTNGIVLRGLVQFGKANGVESSAWCVRGPDASQ